MVEFEERSIFIENMYSLNNLDPLIVRTMAFAENKKSEELNKANNPNRDKTLEEMESEMDG